MNQSETSSIAVEDTTRPATIQLPLWTWLGLWLLAVSGTPILTHYVVHGSLNAWHATLSLFFAINTLICFWEISLGLEIEEIERRHRAGSQETALGLFRTLASPRDLLSPRLWSRIWSVYARYDPSYADRRSYGFAIDVGNGWSTLVPGLLVQTGLTFAILPATVVGILGALMYYQKFYGTCLYFFSYFVNRRYAGQRLRDLIPMVGATNAIWLTFPLIGLYVCIRLILDSNFEIVWR